MNGLIYLATESNISTLLMEIFISTTKNMTKCTYFISTEKRDIANWSRMTK